MQCYARVHTLRWTSRDVHMTDLWWKLYRAFRADGDDALSAIKWATEVERSHEQVEKGKATALSEYLAQEAMRDD